MTKVVGTGKITITDLNDAKTLFSFIKSSQPVTQIYDPNNSTYIPDWTINKPVLIPELYVGGSDSNIIAQAKSIKWFIDGVELIANTPDYAQSGGKPNTLTINTNVLNSKNLLAITCEIVWTDPKENVDLPTKAGLVFTRVQNGEAGRSLYTWVKYADDVNGNGISDDPTGKTFIGIAYNKETEIESNNPADYTWNTIEGSQGVPGTTFYTWLKYADSPTSGMSDLPDGKKYMGLAFNKTTSAESTNYADYNWSLIRGADGYTPIKGTDYFDGVDGQNGTSSYLHVRYSQYADGSSMTTDPTNAKYVGIATTQSSIAPTSNTAYRWSLIKGTDGINGEPGANGQTSYLHIKYSDDGGSTFTSNNGETVGAWIGMYVDFTYADSSSVSAYTWNKIKGADGSSGATGPEASEPNLLNLNPNFNDWSGTLPNYYSIGAGTAPSKVTSGNGSDYAMKYVVASGSSQYLTQPVNNKPYFQYLFIEATFMLESGTIDGAGVLVRVQASSNIDANVSFKSFNVSPPMGKYVTVSKIIKLPYNSTPSGFIGYSVSPMAGYSGFEAITAKTIYIDSVKARPATDAEIFSYENNILINGWTISGTVLIDGGKLYADSVTADAINVANLAAISANLGAVNAGSITGVTLNLADGKFVVDANGNVAITGAINATSGSFSGSLSLSGMLELPTTVTGFQGGSGIHGRYQFSENSSAYNAKTLDGEWYLGSSSIGFNAKVTEQSNGNSFFGTSYYGATMVKLRGYNQSSNGSYDGIFSTLTDRVDISPGKLSMGKYGSSSSPNWPDEIAIYADGTITASRQIKCGNVYFDGVNSVRNDVGPLILNSEGAEMNIGVDSLGYRIQSIDSYYRTYSSAANMFITSNGVIGRSTSARKYKLDEKAIPDDWADKVLDLIPKTWFDKTSVEGYARLLTRESKGETINWKKEDVPYLERIAGLIAEDVEAAGLSAYVVYGEKDKNGKRPIEGLMYDRLWTLLIPVVKKLIERIQVLEEKLSTI